MTTPPVTWPRRNAGLLIVAAIGVVALAIYATRGYGAKSSTNSELARARARLAACLLGEPVVDEPDALRFRRIQLAASASGGDWPKRCATYARAVEAFAPNRGGVSSSTAASSAIEKGAVLDLLSLNRDVASALRPLVDEPRVDWTAATRDVPRPPAPLELDHDPASVADNTSRLAVVGASDLGIVIAGNVLCSFAARGDGVEPVARCSFAASSVAALEGTPHRTITVDRPGDLLARVPKGIRYFTRGDVVLAGPGDFTTATLFEGTLLAWPGDKAGRTVMRRDAAGVVSSIALGGPIANAAIVRDVIVWEAGDRVLARSLANGKAGPIVEVARDAEPSFDHCFTRDVVGISLYSEQGRRAAVFANGTWRVSEPEPSLALQCHGSTVTSISLEETSGTAQLRRLDCTAAGCTTASAELSGVTEDVAAAALGDKIAVVWANDGVYAVVAPASQLASAKPRMIFDGFTGSNQYKFQAQELVHSVHVVGRGTSAIVLLGGERLRALHLRSDGSVERVRVIYD